MTLVRTKGGAKTGGGPGGEAWRVMVGAKSAGRVFINKIDEPPFGPHASIQIFLNVDSQGRGIGRLGYLRACQASAYGTIYAHMRKSNIASARAAEAAGFVDATPAGATQKVMVWRRGKS
jgi:RimJ/RimL family protein N-acetyltransferase